MVARTREISNGERTVNRVQLAAVLLEYDDEVVSGQAPFSKASSSAVLTPYRHILLTPAVNKAISDDFNDYFETVVTSTEEEGAGRPSREGARRSYNAVQERYARTSVLIFENEEEEDRLTEEWGMKDYLSQLGSGSDLGGYGNKSDDSHGLETKSLPDLISKKTTFESTAVDPGLSPTKIRLVQRPRTAESYSALSAGHESNFSLPELPTFENPPSFLSEDPSHDPLLARPRPRRASTVDIPRPKSKAYSTRTEDPTISRRVSTTSLSIASRLAGVVGEEDQESAPPRQSRPQSFFGDETEPEPTVEWTSRFDPSMLTRARTEIESERPVFLNKSAGGPPKLVMMPVPLAGRPPPLFKRDRLEGPGEIEIEPVIEVEKLDRPAGKLFGRSLLDILADRQLALKAQQRHYVSQPFEKKDELGSKASLEIEPKNESQNIRKSRSALSVFGPDLFYQRDLERVQQIEAEELRLMEEERIEVEATLLEKEKIKQAKKTNKLRSAAQRKLEGVPLGPESTFTGPVFNTFSPARKNSLAPSISMPLALAVQSSTESNMENWFAPPSPTHSRTNSDSSDSQHRYDSHRPRVSSSSQPLRPRLVSKMTEEHASNIREGKMGSVGLEGDGNGPPAWTYESAMLPELDHLDVEKPRILGEESFFGIGKRESRKTSSVSSDDRPLGEQYTISDDDLPLGFNRANQDEDDKPLGWNPHVVYQQQQAFMMNQFAQQQFEQQQQQQQFAQLQMMMNGQNELAGENNVDRWRNEVKTDW